MSTQAVRVRSGLLSTRLAVTTAGIKIMDVNDKQSGDTGAITFAELKNLDTANRIFLGPTQAAALAAAGHPLYPNGGSFVILGPSGSGYCGELWAAAETATCAASLLTF